MDIRYRIDQGPEQQQTSGNPQGHWDGPNRGRPITAYAVEVRARPQDKIGENRLLACSVTDLSSQPLRIKSDPKAGPYKGWVRCKLRA